MVYLQLNIFGIVQELEEVIILLFDDIVVDQGCHDNLIFREILLSGCFRELIMLG